MTTFYDWLYLGQTQYDPDDLNKREKELAQLAWEEAQSAGPTSELMRLMPEVLASLKGSGVDVSLAADVERALKAAPANDPSRKFQLGDHVRKTKGSNWRGHVVGTYSTVLTPEGYAVESDTETGSVQIYPAHALELVS